MKKPNRPLALSIQLDGYQEGQIIARSLREAYRNIKLAYYPNEVRGDRDALMNSLKCIYHYYTGKTLK
jgi:hypothetical protein